MTAYNCPFGRACCDGCNYLITGGCIAKQNTSQAFSITHDDMVALWERRKEEPVSKEIGDYDHKAVMESLHPELKEEPVSEDLEEAADNALNNVLNTHEIVNVRSCLEMFRFGAKWQKQQDQSTIELAEGHAYFAGRTKTIDEIKEALLSEVLPCFMHGGEADEVVAKLDEVLNQKK